MNPFSSLLWIFLVLIALKVLRITAINFGNLDSEWEYDFSTEKKAFDFLTSPKKIAKVIIVMGTDGELRLNNPEGYNLKRMIEHYSNAVLAKKPVILYFETDDVYLKLPTTLTKANYNQYWLYIRIEGARGKDTHSFANQTTFMDFMRNSPTSLKFEVAWTDAYPQKHEIQYNSIQFERMSAFMTNTSIASRYHCLIETDLVLVSNTVGFKKLYPNVKGVVIHSRRNYSIDSPRINYNHIKYLCEEYGFENSYLEINDTELKTSILDFIKGDGEKLSYSSSLIFPICIWLLCTYFSIN